MHAEIEDCVDGIASVMPPVMSVLASVLTERAETYCCELSDEGVCC